MRIASALHYCNNTAGEASGCRKDAHIRIVHTRVRQPPQPHRDGVPCAVCPSHTCYRHTT